ncbi:MAG: hypothetical protein R3C15_09110 [Thermoleophilia bacterium]
MRIASSRALRRAVAGAAVVAGALVAGAGAGPGAHGKPAGHEEDEGWAAPASLYRIPAGGGAAERLTQVGSVENQWNDAQPNAPGFTGTLAGSRILFSSTRPAPSDGTTDSELYVMDADGSNVVQLTDNTVVAGESGDVPVNDDDPAWSPDGAWIAYDSAPAAGTSGLADTQVWVMRADGTDARMLTSSPPGSGSGGLAGPSYQPAWAPDGQSIAFSRGSGRNAHIVRIGFDPATGQPVGPETLVTSPGLHTSHPSWSHDGLWLAFQSGAGSNADVSVKRLADGAVFQVAATGNVAEGFPAFSPDDTTIAFQRGDEAAGAAIWLLGFDPTDPGTPTSTAALTAPAAYSDRAPTWSPDGAWVVYESAADNPPAADLAVGAAVAPDPAYVGTDVTFTITATNRGPLTAPGVVVTDALPPGLAFVSASASQGTVSIAGSVVTAQLGDLARSESETPVSATVTVVARPTAPGTLTSAIAVSSAVLDPVPTNDRVESAITALAVPVQPAPAPQPAPQPGPFTPPVPALPAAATDGKAPACTITGTGGDDVLVGTPGPDVVCGLGGNDWIDARGGNDVVRGGAGDDRIYGRAGRDVLRGGPGADRLEGGEGADRLEGGAGGDVLLDRSGVGDRLLGGAGDDRLDARDGRADWLVGGAGRDVGLLDVRLDHRSSLERRR